MGTVKSRLHRGRSHLRRLRGPGDGEPVAQGHDEIVGPADVRIGEHDRADLALLGLGAVLGYLAVGAAIGPWGFHWIGNEGQEITHFAEFGVVVMLFLIGLELQPAMLWKMRHQLIGLGSLQVVLCTLAISGVAMACGLPWKPALATGLILAMSSTAIVLQTLAEKGLLHTEGGQNSFAVLLFQDIAVIPIIALLPLLGDAAVVTEAHGGSNAWMAHWLA